MQVEIKLDHFDDGTGVADEEGVVFELEDIHLSSSLNASRVSGVSVASSVAAARSPAATAGEGENSTDERRRMAEMADKLDEMMLEFLSFQEV